jgi:hypothetical protein
LPCRHLAAGQGVDQWKDTSKDTLNIFELNIICYLASKLETQKDKGQGF